MTLAYSNRREFPAHTPEKPWFTGGISIFLRSSELAYHVGHVARTLAYAHYEVFPVTDGRIVLLETTIPISSEAISEALALLDAQLQSNALSLRFTEVRFNSQNPLETLTLTGDGLNDWEKLHEKAAEVLETGPIPSKKMYAPILYNKAPKRPLSVSELLPQQGEVYSTVQLPVGVKVDGVFAVNRAGNPDQWMRMKTGSQ